MRRGSLVPAGYCGLFGTDAAAISTGVATSVILKATPLSDVERSTMTVLEVATEYYREVLGVEFGHIPAARLRCEHSHRNKVCAKDDCRYYPSSYTIR